MSGATQEGRPRGEAHDARLRRMRMRAWRRGTKEMDLLLGPYADERLAGMDTPALDLFDALLTEGDTDLYAWVAGRATPPERYDALIGAIREAARARHG